MAQTLWVTEGAIVRSIAGIVPQKGGDYNLCQGYPYQYGCLAWLCYSAIVSPKIVIPLSPLQSWRG